MGKVQTPWRPLYVSSVVGGSSSGNRVIRTALSRLAQQVAALSWEGDIDETGVDVIFHITGPLMSPEYTGIRTGRLSRTKKLIVVQVAVPVELEGAPEGQISRSLAKYLLDAAELARATVSKKKDVAPINRAMEMANIVQSIA